MDQSTLVDDRIRDGRRFIERFAADGNTVQAAFWVKEADEGLWYLYVATDLVDREGPAAAYLAVDDSLRKLDQLATLSSQIKVVSPSNPIAQNVLTVMKGHPEQLASWRGGEEIGFALAEQIYVYPEHFFSFAQPNSMTTEDVLDKVVRLMSRGASAVLPSRVTLKDGTSFDGAPFSLQSGGRDALLVQFIGENEVAPRIYRVDEIASIN